MKHCRDSNFRWKNNFVLFMFLLFFNVLILPTMLRTIKGYYKITDVSWIRNAGWKNKVKSFHFNVSNNIRPFSRLSLVSKGNNACSVGYFREILEFWSFFHLSLCCLVTIWSIPTFNCVGWVSWRLLETDFSRTGRNQGSCKESQLLPDTQLFLKMIYSLFFSPIEMQKSWRSNFGLNRV